MKGISLSFGTRAGRSAEKGESMHKLDQKLNFIFCYKIAQKSEEVSAGTILGSKTSLVEYNELLFA